MPLYVWINSELSLIVGTMGICMQNMMTVRQKISNVCRLFFFSPNSICEQHKFPHTEHTMFDFVWARSRLLCRCVFPFTLLLCVSKSYFFGLGLSVCTAHRWTIWAAAISAYFFCLRIVVRSLRRRLLESQRYGCTCFVLFFAVVRYTQ